MASVNATCRCPHCGTTVYEHEEATGSGAERPEAGDLGICHRCARISVYTEEGLRRTTLEEQLNVMSDPELRRIISAVKRYLSEQRMLAHQRGLQS